ncbi:MAG: hypothetical protein OXH59_19310 [Rhodospirillaceae bacterium]|nr:hypothetical protein [Rhodospirillaceae bacterium]
MRADDIGWVDESTPIDLYFSVVRYLCADEWPNREAIENWNEINAAQGNIGASSCQYRPVAFSCWNLDEKTFERESCIEQCVGATLSCLADFFFFEWDFSDIHLH